MCGLPLFPPKPKHEDPERAQRRVPSKRTPREAHAAQPASSQYTSAERAGLLLNAGESHSDHD
jgi:hypothetical protein